MAEGLTKKQFKELRKLEKMQSQNVVKKNDTIKWIAIAVACALFLVLFLGTIIIAKNKNKIDPSKVAQFAPGGHEKMVKPAEGDATPSADPAREVVTLIEYADIQCPACRAYQPLVSQLLAAFPGQLKLIFKNFPITSIHPNAMEAAIAAEAVGRQGKYFEFVDMLYEKQDEWAGLPNPQEKFEQYVKALKLNVDQFKKDQEDPAIVKKINDEKDEGTRNGVSGTPSFFVNGKRINNPAGIEEFKKIISGELELSKGTAPVTPIESTVTPTSSVPQTLPLQQ